MACKYPGKKTDDAKVEGDFTIAIAKRTAKERLLTGAVCQPITVPFLYGSPGKPVRSPTRPAVVLPPA